MEKEAVSLYKQLYKSGYEKGCYNLGLYMEINENYDEAERYYKKSADKGAFSSFFCLNTEHIKPCPPAFIKHKAFLSRASGILPGAVLPVSCFVVPLSGRPLMKAVPSLFSPIPYKKRTGQKRCG